MKNIWLLSRRELSAYLKTPMGYIIAALMLFVDGLLFNYHALGGSAKYSTDVLVAFFAIASFMTMVSGILLTMRLFTEEKQHGTLTLLLTSPLRDHEIILGKFLSALLFFATITCLTLYMPLLIFVNGKVAIGHIFSGYIGLLLLGALSISIGLFASSLSKSQIVSAVIGGTLITSIWIAYLGAKVSDPPFKTLLAYLSPQRHLLWQTGVIQLSDIMYYLSFSLLFLELSRHILAARRWRS